MYAVYNHYHIKIKNKIPSPQKGLFDHFTVSPQPLFTLTLFPVTLINLLVLEISKLIIWEDCRYRAWATSL